MRRKSKRWDNNCPGNWDQLPPADKELEGLKSEVKRRPILKKISVMLQNAIKRKLTPSGNSGRPQLPQTGRRRRRRRRKKPITSPERSMRVWPGVGRRWRRAHVGIKPLFSKTFWESIWTWLKRCTYFNWITWRRRRREKKSHKVVILIASVEDRAAVQSE